MIKRFSDNAWEDYLYWQTQDKKTLKRINKLIKDIERTPFEGMGKPEPLRFNWAGYWSRRVNDVDRIIYSIEEDTLNILGCKGHYD